jgi:hypothetical protein
MTPLIKYCMEEELYFFLQKVDRMKKTASHMNILFLVNIPKEHSKRDMKLAPSGYY